jgi:hypothetical protein
MIKYLDIFQGREIKRLRIFIVDALVKSPVCHPELVSGSHKSLILRDAETSSA